MGAPVSSDKTMIQRFKGFLVHEISGESGDKKRPGLENLRFMASAQTAGVGSPARPLSTENYSIFRTSLLGPYNVLQYTLSM